MPKIVMPSTLETANPRRILFVDKIGSFLNPLVEAAKMMGLEVDVAKGVINPEALQKYGIIWCSWADDVAHHISKLNLPGKLVIQCRSYEAFTLIPGHIGWGNVDCLVYVSPHVVGHLENAIAGTGRAANTAMARLKKMGGIRWLPTCIDMEKWPKPKDWHKEDRTIIWVGRHAPPKNSELLALLIDELPHFKFLIHGPFGDGRTEAFYRWKFGENKNVEIYTPETSTWWEKTEGLKKNFYRASYFLSTSTFESTQLALMEGMAAGCCPLVYQREGLWVPEEWTFTTTGDLMELIEAENPLRPNDYRDFVNTHRNMNVHHRCFANIITALMGNSEDAN